LSLSEKNHLYSKYWFSLIGLTASQCPYQLKISRAIKPPLKTPLRLNPPSSRIFVGGIPALTTEAELLGYFTVYGKLSDFSFPHDDSKPSRNRGFAFLTFDSIEDASKVVYTGQNHLIRAKVVD
jgi:RNA recognition motif-containing protein